MEWGLEIGLTLRDICFMLVYKLNYIHVTFIVVQKAKQMAFPSKYSIYNVIYITYYYIILYGMYNTAHHLYIKYISNYINVYIISIKRGPQVEFIEWKKERKKNGHIHLLQCSILSRSTQHISL